MSTSGPCRDLRHPLFATGLLLAFVTGASAAPPLFNPVAPTPANHAAVAAAGTFDYARRLVALDTTAMQAARKGDVLSIAAPSGEVYAVTYERTDDVYAGGEVWIGHLDDIGHSYPVVISTYEGRVSGSISTPWGTLRLHGAEQAAVLTDTALAGERAFESTIDDSVPI